MKTTLLSLLLLNASAVAQTVGGGYQNVLQINGWADASGYGNSICSIGDYNNDGFGDLLIGAPLTDIGANNNIGDVQIISGADGSTLLELVGTSAGDQFGHSVAVVGDVNLDGFLDFVVGAPEADSSTLTSTGSATLHSGLDGSILLQWFGNATGDLLGISVSDIGDFNADGTPDILAGAPTANSRDLVDCGSVYVYSGVDGSILFHDYGADAGHWFGICVDNAGDADLDGHPDIIAGAPGAENGSWQSSGAAYVYSGATGTIMWEWLGTNTNASMGRSVAGAGDVNGDGHSDLIAGAPGTDHLMGAECGTAKVYSGADGSILHEWFGSIAHTKLGGDVSGAGDVDQDGTPDLLVSAENYYLWEGIVWLYSGTNGSLLNGWRGGPFEELGTCITELGDINNDGYPEIAFNAPFAANPGSVGAVYVHSFSPFLQSTTTTISAAATTMVGLDLSFPADAAGHEYRVLISASGNGPFQYGVDIPLTLDPVVIESFFGNYDSLTQVNMQGNLNMNGQGVAHVGFLPGDANRLIGRTFWIAAIANPSGELPTHSSISVPIQIVN
jgi:hypothetical protein